VVKNPRKLGQAREAGLNGFRLLVPAAPTFSDLAQLGKDFEKARSEMGRAAVGVEEA